MMPTRKMKTTRKSTILTISKLKPAIPRSNSVWGGFVARLAAMSPKAV